MTVALHIGGATKDVTAIMLRKGGALKTVTEGWVRTGGAIKQFYSVLQLALSTYSALGRGSSAASINVISEAVTANVTGAIGTVSHSWTRTAPDAHAWVITSPTAGVTTFSTMAAQGESWTATFIDTVTDQAGQVLASSAVTVNCANIYYGGGYIGGGFGGGGVYP